VVTSVSNHIFTAVIQDAHLSLSEVTRYLCLVECYTKHFIPQLLCLLSRSEGYLILIFPCIFGSDSTVQNRNVSMGLGARREIRVRKGILVLILRVYSLN